MARGILYIILSGLSFFVVNFFVKILGRPDDSLLAGIQTYPAHELVFARSLVSFSISAYIIKKRGLPFFGTNRKWLFLRGFSGMCALTLFFFSLHELPLAIASTLQYLSPIFTVILGKFLFKEELSKIQFGSSILALIGVFLIGLSSLSDHRSGHEINPIWIFLGVISALLSGLAYNSIVKLKATEEPINIVIYFPMIALPITAIWSCIDGVIPRGIELIILLIIGICTQIAQVLMTKALMTTQTALIVPFQYLGAIYALLSGWFIFHEQLEMWSIGGICLILIGVIIGTVFSSSKKVA